MSYRSLVISIVACLSIISTSWPGSAQTVPAGKNLNSLQDGPGILFIEQSLTTAIGLARADKKYIFVDAYAVWCAPCRLLKSSTFQNKEVAKFFNAHFINVSMNLEKGEGIALADKWKIQEYPSLLILDSAGTVVFRSSGFMKPDQLIDFAKQGLNRKL